jgi:hypothetical protein
VHDVVIQVRLTMTPRRDIQPALTHLESALEASCATLMALQATASGMPDGGRDTGPVRAQLARAIESVREAIAELRALHDDEASLLAFGFVLAGDPPWSRSRARRREAQLRPRRTA